MKAVQLLTKTNTVEIVEVPIPKIENPDDVLIKVAYSGICGTDLHMIEGKYPTTQEHPLILGHEFSGIVVNFGTNVKGFEKGDRVAVDPNNFCLTCDSCHLGLPHFCSGTNKNVGSFKNGAWAEFVVISAHMVHKLPKEVTLEQGALAEPLSCLSHGLDIVEPLPVGTNILITGAGIIGVLWGCLCHLRGHRNVTICEPNLARLNIIKQLDMGFNLIQPDQLKENHKKDPNYTFEVIIDCSGYGPIIEYAINLLRKGGKLLCFGVAPPDAEIKINPFEMFIRELTIMGVKINPFSFSKALHLVDAMSNRYLQYDKLAVKTYNLEEYNSALNDLRTGSVLKAIFKF